jgi:hypothetical protein
MVSHVVVRDQVPIRTLDTKGMGELLWLVMLICVLSHMMTKRGSSVHDWRKKMTSSSVLGPLLDSSLYTSSLG